MQQKPKKLPHLMYWVLTFLIFLVILLSDVKWVKPFNIKRVKAAISRAAPTPTLAPEAMVTFKVEIPSITTSGQGIALLVLDEVSGLTLNSEQYQMRANDGTHFMVTAPFPIGSVIHYRYSRQGLSSSFDEYSSDGKMVRYRLWRVDGPTVVQDIVARWSDSEFNAPNGRVQGVITDALNGQPLSDIFINCGGIQTQTGGDGSFFIGNLPIGLHRLTAFSSDGSFRLFQQGALIAENSTTSATFGMERAKMVTMVFIVSVPPETDSKAQIRLAGNLSQLGNTFKDLEMGVSVKSSKMPSLIHTKDGKYGIALNLPAGADLRYKYSLGDGFWNAERDIKGKIRVRQMLIPQEGKIIQDEILSWRDGDKPPLRFDFSTQIEGEVTMQFFVFGWFQPIPIWQKENRHWGYILYNPLSLVDQSFQYRFCQNGKCSPAK